jgi:hypothetical protein
MMRMLRYYWITAKGYRLRPWRSPYLRWRFETFLGPEATHMDARTFFHLAWKHRERMERFIDWSEERRQAQKKKS